MPLTKKGKKIITAMKKEYGKKKGEEVFYASANKGTIKGVHGKRKITKEDIQKYGTEDEKKLLKEYDVFKDEPFEIPLGDPQDQEDDENFFEIPLDDEQDQSLPDEEFSLEDEQEAGTSNEISVSRNLLENVLDVLTSIDESDQVNNLISELGDILGYDFHDTEGIDEDEDENDKK